MSPCLRISQPIPPPSVSPATPVWVTIPAGTASPKAWVSRSSSPSSTPAWARAVRASGSTRMPFIGARSMTMPPSQTESAGEAVAAAADRDDAGRSARANLTAAITSATPAQRAISAGERSIEPFQTLRCSSYERSVGRTSWPRKDPSSSFRAASSSWISGAIVSMWSPNVEDLVSLAARRGPYNRAGPGSGS